jgi:hypothetical protein
MNLCSPCLRWVRRFLATHLTPLEEVPPPAARRGAIEDSAALVRRLRRPLPPRRRASALPAIRRWWLARRPSTSRPCSADGSVATADRCQPMAALSFRGLRFPSRVLARPDLATRRVSASAHSAAPTDPDRHRCRPAPPASLPKTAPGFHQVAIADIPSRRFRDPVARERVRFGDCPKRSVCSCPAVAPPRWLEGGPRCGPSWGFSGRQRT